MLFYSFILICKRTTSRQILARFSSVNFAQGCCQTQKPKKIPTLADERPDLDFDYLLDERNIEKIQKNIQNRKGIGNILKVHDLWKKIQLFEPSKTNENQQGIEEYQNLWDQFYEEALMIPNQTDSEVPIGDESKAKIVMNVPFKPNEAIEKYKIAEEVVKGWKSILYPRRSAGGKSYALIGPTANLQTALFDFAKDVVFKENFQETQVLDILPKVVTQACGLNINQEQNVHPIQYSLTDFPKLCLSGTAEMGIAQRFERKIFNQSDLPLFLVAESRCYRPEVSKSATEAKLYRVHEFNKLEMFAICHPSQSSNILDKFVGIQRSIWDQFGIGYRILDMPSEELGAPASRKFDIEAYMPGRQIYGEVSSASNCTDYQSRRLGMKFKNAKGELDYVHTCNGTAMASSRSLITILENFQTKRGFELPKVLEKYISKEKDRTKLKISPA